MDWNYVSGFFDADGCITYGGKGRRNKDSIQIHFSNNEISILEQIQKFILDELGIKGHISRKKKNGYSDSFDLKYTYLAKTLLLSDHIKSKHPIKKRKLLLVSELKELTPRNGKYTPELLEARESFRVKFFE